MFVDAFSHRKVISQSPSKISQACGATKEREEFKGGARDLGSSKLSKVAKNIFGFQKPTLILTLYRSLGYITHPLIYRLNLSCVHAAR